MIVAKRKEKEGEFEAHSLFPHIRKSESWVCSKLGITTNWQVHKQLIDKSFAQVR